MAEREELLKDLNDELKDVRKQHEEINAKIQAITSEHDHIQNQMKVLINNLATNGVSIETLLELDQLRVKAQKTKDSEEERALRQASTELEDPMNDLSNAIKQLNK